MSTQQIRFHNELLTAHFDRYRNGNLCVRFVDGHGLPYMTASTNADLPIELAPDEFIVKDYSENAGILAAMTDAGFVEASGPDFENGFITLHVRKLRVPLPEQIR